MESKRSRHATYNINYHFVWCPKYRRTVLGKDVARRLEELIDEKTAELNGEEIDLTVQPDHLHLFCPAPPMIDQHQIMYRLEGYMACVLGEAFPWLKSRLPSRLTRAYYVGTAGQVVTETIRKTIEEQKGC